MYTRNIFEKAKPQELQKRFKFGCHFYFARRVNEDIDKFTKDMFTTQITQILA